MKYLRMTLSNVVAQSNFDVETFRRSLIFRLSIYFAAMITIANVGRHFFIPLLPIQSLSTFFVVVLLLVVALCAKKKSLPSSMCSVAFLLLLGFNVLIPMLTHSGLRAPANGMWPLIPIIGYFLLGKMGGIITGVLTSLMILFGMLGEYQGWITIHPTHPNYSYNLGVVYLFICGAGLILGKMYSKTNMDLLQRELQLKSQLAHQSRIKSLGEMSGGVAHEINNPLAVILGSIDLLPNIKENDEKFNARLKAIERSSLRTQQIVGGLKAFSGNHSGKNFSYEFLRKICLAAIRMSGAKIEKFVIQVSLDVDENLSVYCDPIAMQTVLMHLIENSVGAINQQTSPWIKISCFEKEHQIILRVLDSGAGIPKEIEHNIFDPFFTTKGVGKGVGLGLSISKGILEEHNAEILLNSEVANTCFEIVFQKRLKKVS